MPSAQVPVGQLSVCPTPIGNLRDVTLRTLDRLREADVVACEDTRRTRVLLERFEIETKLVSFHEHNERERTAELVQRIQDGVTVALVSDAGMPLVSDPGYVLVRACLDAGLPVEVLPGASAPLMALVASGLPAERFRFAGFLPRKRAELERVLTRCPDTLVAFESPRRLAHALALLAEQDPEREVAVCRELTKLHEEVRRGKAAELAVFYAETPPRGEVVVVIAACVAPELDRDRAVEAVGDLVDAGARPRSAASVVASLTGVPANQLYQALTD